MLVIIIQTGQEEVLQKKPPAPTFGGKPVFHSGPPPHIGWWNTSFVGGPDAEYYRTDWRWWNGKHWSITIHQPSSFFRQEEARILQRANTPATSTNSQITWSDYYPHNAVVPRVAPT
jgi:hypothetical protein